MNTSCDIYCPDCGQGFPREDDHEKHHFLTHPQKKRADSDSVFKKPTMLTKVMKNIWKPFSSTKSAELQGVASGTRNGFLRPSQPSGSGGFDFKRPEAKARHQPYPRRSFDDRSDVGSQTGSWISSVFNFTKWNQKQQIAAAIARPSNNTLRSSCNTGNSSSPFNHPRYNDFQICDEEGSVGTEDGMEDDCDSDLDSDRLNLKEYVQPRKGKHEQVESWVNNLKDDMDAINSLLTPDLSCDCKNGTALARNKLITKFLEDSGEQILKLQALLIAQESHKEKEIKLIRSLAKGSEQVKAAILDCSKSQQLIIYKHITEMAKLDKEEEAEDSELAKQQAEKVEELQTNMLAETVTSDSKNLLGFFS